MNADPPHILVVDDDARLRELLRRYLSGQGFRVSTAVDAGDARARLAGLAFDLLVIDVMMPGESGVELVRSLRQESAVPVLLLTALGEPEDRIAGLESGADDYLTKPFEPRELLLRISTILRRTRPPAVEGPVRFGPFAFDPERGELLEGERRVRLTRAEASLLSVFARRPGATLSRDELAREAGLGSRTRTLDVQIARLRRKIEADPKAPRFLQTVWGEGYVLRAG